MSQTLDNESEEAQTSAQLCVPFLAYFHLEQPLQYAWWSKVVTHPCCIGVYNFLYDVHNRHNELNRNLSEIFRESPNTFIVTIQ